MDCAIVIPSFDPDGRLPDFVRALRAATDLPIVVVDDGSRAASKPRFDDCRAVSGVEVLVHPANAGKGRALKTAFAHLLKTRPEAIGCVTADGDGEHAVEDVLRCVETLRAHSDAVVLGCRRFFGNGAPFKSWFGNTWTRLVFLLATGRRFRDTQTGLRGIPTAWMRRAADIPGERFEFETAFLLALGKSPLVEFPIRTLYTRDESGVRQTHFHPIRDSWKITKVVFAAMGRRAKRDAE